MNEISLKMTLKNIKDFKKNREELFSNTLLIIT